MPAHSGRMLRVRARVHGGRLHECVGLVPARAMLFHLGMNTKLMLATLLLSSVAAADRGPAAPDFLGRAPSRHIDPSMVASPMTNPIEPVDVVAFKLDSATLTDGGMAQLDSTALWLKVHPRHRLVLEGHTDKLGAMPYNEDLANRRLSTVRAALMARGIHSDRIVMVTYGEADAITPENPNDRRVVMFATTMPVRKLVNASLDQRPALVATWTERGALVQLQHGLGETPTRTVTPAATARR